MKRTVKVGLIELPMLKLLDPHGRNWKAQQRGPLGAKQILAGTLLSAGYEVKLFNLKEGPDEVFMGETEWKRMKLQKIAFGTDWSSLDPKEYGVWGLTNNFLQEREIALRIIKYLSSGGGQVVVGGSDAFAEPKPYLEAGAVVVVLDKSGMSNQAAIETALGKTPEGSYRLYTRNGYLQSPGHFSRLHPENWPLPPLEFVRETLTEKLWDTLPEALIGSVMFDHGCDRHCDFCETPNYKLGYQYMSPERALEWLALQKKAGAAAVTCLSDQFLGRILYKNGREEILSIMKGLRELKIAMIWKNGLELAKATLGRGFKNGDPTPDGELVEALWGWNGQYGCAYAFAPAERPVEGTRAYAKLLSWQDHVKMLKAIVRAGAPDISYGVIIGFPDDTPEKMKYLLDAILNLRKELKELNPKLLLRIRASNISPIPGTPVDYNLRKLGLIRFSDPIIVGGHWTASADTKFMSYEEVSDWQIRIFKETNSDEFESGHQGITAFD
ncbi:MAG: radical SAM protein [Parcubacteria group bacterium]|nr:radical SAM protein [Parcubacteria group bacterium]